MTAKERYLRDLEDPASGITLETPPHLIEGTIQKRFSDAALEGIEAARKLTKQEFFDSLDANPGWIDRERTRKAWGLSPKT
jgi:hypothetical protein